eukprot:87989-Alexandrium_andersonii.AAC.1
MSASLVGSEMCIRDSQRQPQTLPIDGLALATRGRARACWRCSWLAPACLQREPPTGIPAPALLGKAPQGHPAPAPA